MKKRHIVIAAAIAMACASMQGQTDGTPLRENYLEGGPGIAISGTKPVSGLPERAQTFLENHYANDSVASCREDFVKQSYHVELSDGTDITFNKDGAVTDIKGGKDSSLSEGTIKDVLPAKTVEHLRQTGVIDEVNMIKHASGKGFGVVLLNNVPPQMIFDVDGTFIIVAG